MTSASSIAAENRNASGAFDTTDSLRGNVVAMAARRAASTFSLPWSLAMIAVGLVTVALCILVPLREERRQLAHEFAGIQAEADYMQRQATANAAFLERIHTDPALAERLVMRATRTPAAGKQFLDGAPAATFGASPYAITQLEPPAPQPAYRSDLPPILGNLLIDIRSRAILMAAGLFLMAAAVVLGKAREVRGSVGR